MSNAPGKTWPLQGGIHPPENKHQSMALPLAPLPLPDQLILPLNMHLGAPAQAIVQVGQRVLTGEMIAEPGGPFSAAVHASSSGIVKAIEDRPLPHPSGLTGPCIVIEPDGHDEWISLRGCPDYRREKPAELIECLRRAGIAGMGGAGFPTAIKLAPKANQPIHTLILNGTECEPYITADDRLMRDRADQVIAGAELMAYLLHEPARVVIGIEDNKPEAIQALRAAAAGKAVEIAVFPTKYPSGGEKQLIYILTGQEVPHGKIPADIGIVVQNVGTAVAAYRAVVHGEPLISRITTVVGEALEIQRNVEVRLGTPIGFVLAEHGLHAARVARLILGGPMMGYTVETGAVPVVKTTNCILAPSLQELPAPPPALPCIRCGLCAEACPASLLPQQLYWYGKASDHDKLEAYNLFDCIECGACAYVCPSSIPLVQYYRAAKGEIRQARADKVKSDRSRERFAFRQERLARVEAEKEAKRLERARAAESAKAKLAAAPKAAPGSAPIANPVAGNPAAGDPAAGDPVAAAIARAKAQSAQLASASPADQKARLERQLSSAQSRLALCEEKLGTAESAEQAEKFRAAIKAAQLKVQEAEQKLAELDRQVDAAVASDPAAGDPAAGDPVAAAIARAQAKMAMAPDEKLRDNIASLEKRLAAAEQKLREARTAAGSPAVTEALQTGVDKLREKLAQAQTELAQLTPAAQTAAPVPPDAAQAAIERARARAAAMADMSEDDKLRDQLSSLQARVAKAREKFAAAEAEGSEHLEALRNGLEKLEAKLADTQSKLENA